MPATLPEWILPYLQAGYKWSYNGDTFIRANLAIVASLDRNMHRLNITPFQVIKLVKCIKKSVLFLRLDQFFCYILLDCSPAINILCITA